MNTHKCEATVYPKERWGTLHGYQCTRKIWKDGYCKIHHPDSVKVRRKKSMERYEENKKKSDWYLLNEANKKIEELEAEIERLKRCLDARR